MNKVNTPDIKNIPQELSALPHWILWRKELRDGQETKVPYQVNGGFAKCDSPHTWATLKLCVQKMNGYYSGIGFQAGVEPCGNILIDLDHCIKDGEIESWARQIIGDANSYTEISPGGDGIHIFCGGKLPGASIKAPDAEIYDHKRYFTFTGRIESDRKAFRQLSEPEILNIYKQIEARKPKKAEPQKTAISNSSTSDKDLLNRMFHSKNGAAIERLYKGDVSGHGGDQSSADLALCAHLAFWTNRNLSVMDSLFRSSGLMRDKWDVKHSSDGRTYGEMTLQKAIDGCTQSIGDRPANSASGEYRPENLPERVVSIEEILNKVYIPTWDNCPLYVAPLIELSSTRILTKGNLSMLTACAGAGKSSVLGAMCAALLSPMGDNLGLSVNAKSLLYIDSERSRRDHNVAWQSFLKRAEYSQGTIPTAVFWENIRSIENLDDRLLYLWGRIDSDTVPELVLIDGIGDFCADPNDSTEVTGLIYRLAAVADVRNIGVLVTLHNNPAMNSDKARGVLGSELWRKSESVLIIEKLPGEDIRRLTTDYTLGKNRSGSDKLSSYFRWDTFAGMHVSCTAPAGPKGKTGIENDRILALIGTKQAWAYTDLKNAVMELTGKHSRTVSYKISDLVELKKILKNDNSTYSIAEQEHAELPEWMTK